MHQPPIKIKRARVHNLKNVSIELAPNQLIVFTGVSGSGKSSLAFDTIYIEGQRRYVESLSTHARRALGDMSKPDADSISGISPTIAIEQKTSGKNPRSTVGTLTGLYDFFRVLFARLATPYCPVSGERVLAQSKERIIKTVLSYEEGSKWLLLAPYARDKKAEFKEDFAEMTRKGFMRVRLDGRVVEIGEIHAIDPSKAHDLDIVIDRIVMREEEKKRLTESLMQTLDSGNGTMIVLSADESAEHFFSMHAFSPKSGLSYQALEPQDFSFNHTKGMCDTCQGLGTEYVFDLERIIDPKKSIAQDCCVIASSYNTVRYGNIYNNLARLYDFDIDTPWEEIPMKGKHAFLYGIDKKWVRMEFVHPDKKTHWTDYVSWKGVLFEAKQRLEQAQSDKYKDKIESLMKIGLCPTCRGSRLKPYPAAAKFQGKTIGEISGLSVDEALKFFQEISLSWMEEKIGGELLKEIKERLFFLHDVGLYYLTIDRTAPTLSGGEAQRVRLASQIGSGLVGATYVLDEPSIGLHPRDNEKLIKTLRSLCDKGNTVIVVEHDEETILSADQVCDIGPLAGEKGGELIFQGSPTNLLQCTASITADFLSGRKTIPVPKKRRKPGKEKLTIIKACHHNLQDVTVSIPLKVFVAVTGVSGSGKSSLIQDVLYPALANALNGADQIVGEHEAIEGIKHLDKVIAIDQSPIGRTPRSNPATYIKVFDEIRDLFCMLPEAQAQGLRPGHFSFNVREGSCPHCLGMGMIEIDMDFLEDQWTECPFCKGKRFEHNVLSVLFKGKSIYDVLEMTANQVLQHFEAFPKIVNKVQLLLDVGLDYLRLGQSSTTLSGGEAQRIKLAKELSKRSTGKTFYILDEPTTGLHFQDILRLHDILQRLVDKGNTVLVIEHNMDLVKTCDYIVDLGPDGGKFGGQIVARGTPEELASLKTPTSRALQKALGLLPYEVAKKSGKQSAYLDKIVVLGAEQNNLKGVDATLPRGKITICTGPSGSGKSSFAFETVYAEGQRRYTESLSPYARQLVKQMSKAKVQRIEGLSAAIAIEQKAHAGNPRSTIGTMTEIYDYLRLLYAFMGIPHCPETKEKIETISKEFVLEKIIAHKTGQMLIILSLASFEKGEAFTAWKARMEKLGYLRFRLDGTYYEMEDDAAFDPVKKHELLLVIDRIKLDANQHKRILDAIDAAASFSSGKLIAAIGDQDYFYNLSFAVASTGKSYSPITSHTFSFNTEQGACLECQGLGTQYGINLAHHEEIQELTAEELFEYLTGEYPAYFKEVLKALNIPKNTLIQDLAPFALQKLFFGSDEPISLKDFDASFQWLGVNKTLEKALKHIRGNFKERLLPLLEESPCFSCRGKRLNPLALHVTIGGKNIIDFCDLPINEALHFIQHLSLADVQQKVLGETIEQLQSRLDFLVRIGLDYLSLSRSAPSLSGGETQRIRLARQLGGGLSGCLYVLDEPTIGLHPYNNTLLNNALLHLKNQGNTLVLVEHDPMTMQIADYFLDFGPGAGKFGGEIVASGTLEEIKNNPQSLTGAYLSGSKKIPRPAKRRTSQSYITIRDANLHNLNNLTVNIPTGVITCVTGLSGSGKSTLISDIFAPAATLACQLREKKPSISHLGATITGLDAFDHCIVLHQNPIGHTIRSDVSTYIDLFTSLRTFFASLPEARMRGLEPRYFSHNHPKGACSECQGLGFKSISLQFLPPVKLQCEACQGYRLNPMSLLVQYKDKHLGQVLQLNPAEALAFLPPMPKVERILKTLLDVGLGYLTLGQEIATLSGGEAQRIRLCKELAKRSSSKTLYILDEPTIGLHYEDIARLLKVFDQLTSKGSTLVIIEHNLDVICHADHIIDLGPGSGIHGGNIVAEGTPETVANTKASLTGQFIREHQEKSGGFINASK